jgi:hypothetical protein
MGQYHMVVNLDKHEFVMPHRLGDGLKLREFAMSEGGVMTALAILLSCSDGRGGGDFCLQDTEWGGRWAGDRIAIVGDYAMDDDLPAEHAAGSIYDRCKGSLEQQLEETREWYRTTNYVNLTKAEVRKKMNADLKRTRDEYREFERLGLPTYTDISAGLQGCLEQLGYHFSGDGWMQRTYGDGGPTNRLVPDVVVNITREG